MQLVETHLITSKHSFYKECDDLCFKAKNLYNAANYIIRQNFCGEGEKSEAEASTEETINGPSEASSTRTFISFFTMDKLIREMDFGEFQNPYRALPRAQLAQQVLRRLDQDWRNFFRAIKDWKKNKNKYNGMPKPPKYKHKKDGRVAVTFPKESIRKAAFLQEKKFCLSGTNIKIKSKRCLSHENLNQIVITPTSQGAYTIRVIYTQPEATDTSNTRKMAIDLGVKNLATLFLEGGESFIVSGGPIKSCNQFYNKTKAKLQGELKKSQGKYWSKGLKKLTEKRSQKINDYFHKASKKIVDLALKKSIGTLVIGKNKGWKEKSNLGKKNNQNFVQIPFESFVQKLTYKAQLKGLEVVLVEESYTSKIDHLAGESLQKQTDYLGERAHRGLFKSSTGKILNADVNGALGILRKAIPGNKVSLIEGIEGSVLNPVKLLFL